MSVTRKEVLHVAALARLELNPEDVERFTAQLNNILSHVEELEAIDSTHPAEAHAEDTAVAGAALYWGAPLRADVTGADEMQLPPADMAAGWTDGFFTVPRLQELDGDASRDTAGSA